MKRKPIVRYRLDAVLDKDGTRQFVAVAYFKNGTGRIDGHLTQALEAGALLEIVPEYADHREETRTR